MTSPLAPASRPLVVAVEGRCFAGKTTLCHALAAQLDGTAVIPEYADLAPLPPFPPRTPADVTAALQHLLIVERRRTRLWRPDARLALCDRSPLTLITYEHGSVTVSASLCARVSIVISSGRSFRRPAVIAVAVRRSH